MSTDKKDELLTPQAIDNTAAGNLLDGATVGTTAPISEKTRRELIAALKQNWQREIEGVRTYRDLAHKERDAARRNILQKMADAEARHAA